MKNHEVSVDEEGIHVKIFQHALTELFNSITLFYEDDRFYLGFSD